MIIYPLPLIGGRGSVTFHIYITTVDIELHSKREAADTRIGCVLKDAMMKEKFHIFWKIWILVKPTGVCDLQGNEVFRSKDNTLFIIEETSMDKRQPIQVIRKPCI